MYENIIQKKNLLHLLESFRILEKAKIIKIKSLFRKEHFILLDLNQ